LTCTSLIHSSPTASANGHDDRNSQHQKYYVPPSSSYDDYGSMDVSMGSMPTVSADNDGRAAASTAWITSRAHLLPITTDSSALSVLSPLSSYDSPHLPHSAHPSSATTDYGASDVNVKVESPTSNANSPHLQHSHPGGGYGGHADMVGMGMMMSGIPTPVSWR